MSDPKDTKSKAGMFTNDPRGIRDVLPTEAEGDALLDMLFDDAGPKDRDTPDPASSSVDVAPTADVHDRPTPPGGHPVADEHPPPPAPSVPRPKPPMARGEVVAPPGWKISPTPPPSISSSRQLEDLVGEHEYASAPPPDLDDDVDLIALAEPEIVDEPTLAPAPPPRRPPPAPPSNAGGPPRPRPKLPSEPFGDRTLVEPAPRLDRAEPFALPSPPVRPAGPAPSFPDAATLMDDLTLIAPAVIEDPSTVDSSELLDSDGLPVALTAHRESSEVEPVAEAEEAPDAFENALTEEATSADPSADELEPISSSSLRGEEPSVAPIQAPSFAPLSEGLRFEGERDACVLLAEDPSLLESFRNRARWLREEASLAGDKPRQARLLLVASELFAMSGDTEEAAAVAFDAQSLDSQSPMILRQHRGLLQRNGNLAGMLEVADLEAKVASSAEAKAHASELGSEIARITQGDETLARKRADVAMRAAPTDPRAHVQRFAEALASSSDPPPLAKLRPIEPEGTSVLGDAFARICAVRGAPKPREVTPPRGVEAFQVSRRAAIAGDTKRAVSALAELDAPDLAGATAWLVAYLNAAASETRDEASEGFSAAAGGTHPSLAMRALATLGVQSGGSFALPPEDAPGFSSADRLALAALAGGGDAHALLREPTTEAQYVATSARAALIPRDDQDRLGLVDAYSPLSAAARSSLHLGRTLATLKGATSLAETPLSSSVARALDTAGLPAGASQGLLRALLLELDIDARSIDRLAETLRAWGDESDPSMSLALGLVSELADNAGEAKAHYSAALERAGDSRGVDSLTRVLAALETKAGAAPGAVAALFANLGKLAPTNEARALALIEAGVWYQRGTADDEAESAFRSASETDPTIPWSYHLGERLARQRGDQDALLEWLRARRSASDSAMEKALDFVREALLVSDGESRSAQEMLEMALTARPADIGLRELYERLSVESPKERAAWREDSAKSGEGREAARLGLEAAIEYEISGDLESAFRCVKLAEASGEAELARVFSYRLALFGFGTSEFVDSLLPNARQTEDNEERLEAYERLAELDERGRGDTASGLLFRRTILEENPTHLRTLRRVASTLMAQGREDELEAIVMEIARALDGAESVAHAALAARLRHRTSWEETYDPIDIAFSREPRASWVLRQKAAHSRHRGEHALAASCDRELLERTERPHEIATLALRASESSLMAAHEGPAIELLNKALEVADHHTLARLRLAALLERGGKAREAATELEAAQDAMVTPLWKLETNLRAGILYQDGAQDLPRARGAFERVLAVAGEAGFAPPPELFDRLKAIYVADGARSELAQLLERQLESVDDPAARVEMEVMRGKALAEVGDGDAAKRALLGALESNPDHLDALHAFVELSLADEDWEGAEQALIRVARLTTDPDGQREVYLRLGELYDDKLPNPERAEDAYREILKRRPQDVDARLRLVLLVRRSGDLGRALEEQNVLVEQAQDPDEKCQRTIELAEIVEELGELKKAENTLIAVRKAFPKSDPALRALVKFYQRTSQTPSAAVLLDRAVADARRALSTGRFESHLFETLNTAAELRGRSDAATVARATVLALEGKQTDLAGAGTRAGQASLDDLLAPDVMTPAFRELLLKTGNMLDAAVPFNFESIRAVPLAPNAAALGDEVRALAGAYGLAQIQIFTSSVLGPVCIAASAHPATVVFGQAVATAQPSPVRTFLIHRAMKVIQANAAAFARTAPIDLWPLLAGYLKVWSPSFVPQGVDAAKLTEAHARLARVRPPSVSQDVPLLASDVIGSIGNRASILNTAMNGWGARAGLLALADPNIALEAIACASGALSGPPKDGKDRVTWVARNAEARDLILYSVSDAYFDARARLGLR